MNDIQFIFTEIFVAIILILGIGWLGANIARIDYMKDGAMEVYRGNTTLEYKVVDGVKVDSCVIFLKK